MITDLDAILKDAEPNTRIELGPGLHTTYGCGTDDKPDGPELKQGCDLIGHESGTTVILCIRPMTEEAGDASVILGQGENVVANLTVDGGVPLPEQGQTATPYPRKRNLVFLKGTDNAIVGVTGRRQYGIFADGRESFGLSCWGKSTISNCKVLDVVGTYATGMQAHALEWCEVTFPRLRKGERGNFRAAFNMGETDGGTVSNCQAYWAMAGIYTDWKDCRNLEVTDCLLSGFRFFPKEGGTLIAKCIVESANVDGKQWGVLAKLKSRPVEILLRAPTESQEKLPLEKPAAADPKDSPTGRAFPTSAKSGDSTPPPQSATVEKPTKESKKSDAATAAFVAGAPAATH